MTQKGGKTPKKQNPSQAEQGKAVKEKLGKTLDKMFGPKKGDGSNRS